MPLDPELRRRVEPILDRVLAAPSASRAVLVAELCGADPVLRAEVERLVAAEADTRSLFGTATARPNDAPRPGFTGPKQIAGYCILRELGAGGMGTVFEAYQAAMQRRVALKVLSRHQGGAETAGQRFQREAWIAGKLDHPNLVKVFEHGEWEELAYYSMELVGGGSLHEVIANMKRWGRDDRIGLEFGSSDYVRWAMRQVVAAARGLDHAHRQGVVHRDVKPLNLLLSEVTGEAKVTDFGLAREEDATRLTTAGKVMGSLFYMAPEQLLGQLERIDARTDVYALGVTLFELLTLDLPYVGASQQLYVNAVLTAEARPLRKHNARVGRDLEVVIRKALEKDPRDRYASAAAFADDLENVAHFRPIAAVPPRALRRGVRLVQRRPVHAALAAVIAVTIPVVAVLSSRAVERRRLAEAAEIAELQQELRWHWQRDQYSDVLEPASAILRLDPHHATALQTRAAAHIALAARAEGEEAERLAAAALADVSQLVAAHPAEAWPHRLRAHALRTFGRDEEARAAEVEAAALLRGASPGYFDLYFDALAAAQSGDDARAIALLGEALVLRPQDLAALFARAVALERSGRVDDAIQDLRVLLALSPEDEVTRYKLGKLLVRAGAVEEGQKHIERVVAARPSDPAVYQDLADVALERGRLEAAAGEIEAARASFADAEAHARRSVELDPRAAWSHLNLGASLMELNRLEGGSVPARIAEAREHYEQALALLPAGELSRAYLVALVNTCDAQIQAGDLDGALHTCTAVTTAAPSEPIGFYNLAAVHALAGRTEEALAALERDFALGDHDWATLESDAWFASLRDAPSFRDLVARMKRGATASPAP